MTIARLMQGRSGDVIGCDAAERVGDAVKLLAEKRIGAIPVFSDGRIAGIFSERDVVYQLAAHGPAMLDKTVGEVMTSPPITVDPQTGVLDALGLMTRRRIRHLPVVENDAICGFVSIGDLVKYRIDAIVSEAEAMRSYIQSA
ncbi:CBS domain-containing protein [Novosphingobium sp.]|uniref:CBS domain-containing protein n=1 Tax=Novosphingobium sp. TaxID=1874826 RepID=UPI00286CF015|nr:CBS domain-containing protein [Novosphingobium sp.]